MISSSQPLHDPASTWRIASARPNSDCARRSISRAIVTASAPSPEIGSVTMPVRRIFANSCMLAATLAPQRAQHRLAFRQAVAQQLTRDAQQLGDQAAAHVVIRERAFLARGNQVAGTQRGEVLRDCGLVEAERVLQVLHAALARREQLQNPDARGMAEGA